jgi:hypothetical protein
MKISRAIGVNAIPLVSLLTVLVISGCSSQPAGQNLGEEALQNLTPLEKTILADKLVSPSEYKLAQEDTAQCLRKAGFTVNAVQAEDGTLDYTISAEEPAINTTATDAKYLECEKRSTGVGAVFILQHKTTLFTRPLPGLKEALANYKG